MATNPSIIFGITKIAILVLFTANAANAYRKFRYPSLLYFLGALAIYTLTQITGFAPPPENIGFAALYFHLSFQLMGVIYALFLILLFFDSFEGDSVLTPRNVILAMVTSALEVLLLVVVLLLSNIDSEMLRALDEGTEENVSFLVVTVMLLAALAVFLAVITFIATAIMVMRSIGKKLKSMTEPSNVNRMKRMQLAMYLIIIGSVLGGLASGNEFQQLNLGVVIQNVTVIVGLLMLMRYTVHREGMFLFQGENLQKLMIIDPYGIPTYSYTFWARSKEELNENLEDIESNEVLFSGALKSISLLLSESSGTSEESLVEEIVMSDMKLMVQTIGSGFSIVLMVNKSTRFFRDALLRFSESMVDLVQELNQGDVFDTNQIKIANGLLESSFGQTSFV